MHRVTALWAWWLLTAAACDGAGDPDATCVAAQTAALYFGREQPRDMAWSTAQRAAIGGVSPDPFAAAVCTGVVVRHGWVLTAAHCDLGAAPSFRPSTPGARSVEAIGKSLHPSLDVMLLELPPTAGTAVAPLPLWDAAIDRTWIDREVTLAGIGETETGRSGTLRFLTARIAGLDDASLITDGMGKAGACTGDSGGPLLVAAGDGGPRVAGILDRGSRDCIGIDVYVRSDRIREWMNEATGSGCRASE